MNKGYTDAGLNTTEMFTATAQSAISAYKRPPRCIQRHPIPLLQVMDQYDDFEWTLAMYVFQDAAQHRCDHYDALNRIENPMKIRRHSIPDAFFFVIERTVEGVPVCVKDNRSYVHRTNNPCSTNIVKLFMQTFVGL